MKHSIPVLALITVAALAGGCGGGIGRPGPVTGGTTVTLGQVQASIFTPSCAIGGCHVGPGAPFGLDLSDGMAYDNLVAVLSSETPAFERIEPFDANNSYVFMKITGDNRILGDAMPPFGAPLSQDRVDLMRDWIEQGANP